MLYIVSAFGCWFGLVGLVLYVWVVGLFSALARRLAVLVNLIRIDLRRVFVVIIVNGVVFVLFFVLKSFAVVICCFVALFAGALRCLVCIVICRAWFANRVGLICLGMFWFC